MPPSVILEVMRLLHEEMELREETRAAEQAKPALDENDYVTRATALAAVQDDLADRTGSLVKKIIELPEGTAKFAREIAILARVEEVMNEAHQLLARPDTGPQTIAAETEAIELLLQSKRIRPKGGGGGSSPGGGGTGDTDQSALALLGQGNERKAVYEPRTTIQATGARGVALPAEFRQGLDTFFEALEKSGAATGE